MRLSLCISHLLSGSVKKDERRREKRDSLSTPPPSSRLVNEISRCVPEADSITNIFCRFCICQYMSPLFERHKLFVLRTALPQQMHCCAFYDPSRWLEVFALGRKQATMFVSRRHPAASGSLEKWGLNMRFPGDWGKLRDYLPKQHFR